MRHYIWHKSQGLGLEISLHIFHIWMERLLGVTLLKSWTLTLSVTNVVYAVQSLAENQKIFIKHKITYGRELQVGGWKVRMPQSLVFSFFKPLKGNRKRLNNAKLHVSAPNGSKWRCHSKPAICSVNKRPSSLTYKKYFESCLTTCAVPLNWPLSLLSSSSDFSSWVILY